jgi:hypothetical protein
MVPEAEPIRVTPPAARPEPVAMPPTAPIEAYDEGEVL